MPIALSLMVLACSPAPEPGPPEPSEVGYALATPQRVAIERSYPARLVAWQSSEVRPQVSGVIQRRLFTEGALVRAGQPLYQIDRSLFQAAVNEAVANLDAARASQAAAGELVERYRPLVAVDAVAPQEYTNAVAAARSARAATGQAEARLETARVNLRFTTVPAPITGRIGRSLLTVGALATGNQAEPLATIQQLDPIFVDIQQSAAELMALRQSIVAGGLEPNRAEVRLTLPGGQAYPYAGIVEFSEAVVNPETGAVTLRARVQNPDGALMPGLFLQARFAQAAVAAAYLVPQQALMRDPQGAAYVYVIDGEDRARRRDVDVAGTQGDAWIVTSGLNPNDRVVTEGLGRIRPDAVVRPVVAAPGSPSRAPSEGR